LLQQGHADGLPGCRSGDPHHQQRRPRRAVLRGHHATVGGPRRQAAREDAVAPRADVGQPARDLRVCREVPAEGRPRLRGGRDRLPLVRDGRRRHALAWGEWGACTLTAPKSCPRREDSKRANARGLLRAGRRPGGEPANGFSWSPVRMVLRRGRSGTAADGRAPGHKPVDAATTGPSQNSVRNVPYPTPKSRPAHLDVRLCVRPARHTGCAREMAIRGNGVRRRGRTRTNSISFPQ
jgi:hypothetical protein